MLSKLCRQFLVQKNIKNLIQPIVYSQSQTNQEVKSERTIQADEENQQIITKKERISTARLVWRIFWYGSLALFSYNLYLLETSKNPEKENGSIPYYSDAAKYVHRKYHDLYDFITKPPLQKLLPDMPTDIPGFMPGKTIVLNLEGLLIKSEYVFGKGLQIKKRPGVKKFLQALQQAGYEIVIFSDSDLMFTQQIAQQLDPQQSVFVGKFANESLTFDKGTYVRDINYLNRDLKKILVIDQKEKLVQKQKENALIIPEFTGDANDNTLFELIPFVQYLGQAQVRDVRNEIKKYGETDQYKNFLVELEQKRKLMAQQKNQGMGGFLNTMAQQKQSRFR